MTRWILLRAGACALSLVGLAAAAPSLLAGVAGGLWEVTGQGRPVRLCVADPLVLAAYEHRSVNCTRSVIRRDGQSAVVSYSCSGGGFGQSQLSVLTPRSLQIDTQGILGGEPYHYVLDARRVGDCPPH
ncbi:MAG TPA: hypothetical protein VFT61_06765 [Sphingomicrobium sp.]|nr:hypothetical protein [Sphingomicrobium sp.]